MPHQFTYPKVTPVVHPSQGSTPVVVAPRPGATPQR